MSSTTHTPDIVTRLRESGDLEAADEIARLRLEVEHRGNEVERLRGENLCLNMQAQIAESHFKDIVILCSIPRASLTKAAIRAAEGREG